MRLYNRIIQFYRAHFPLEVQAKYGHQTSVKGEVTAHGITQKYKLPLIKGQTEFCRDCISEMAIRCDACDQLILPGMPVILHAETNTKNKEGVRKYRGQIISCSRFGCDTFFEEMAGHWQAPGIFVPLPDTLLRLSPRVKKQ